MTDEDIPSQRLDLLRSIQGARIVRLTRCCWARQEASGFEDHRRPEQTFSHAAGPLLVALDSGLVFGAASQPSWMSVTLWVESHLRTDPDLHVVEADDVRFSEPGFAQMLGKRVAGVAILTRQAERAMWQSCAREVGVVLVLDGAPELVLSHGLHDDSDDFSVLMRKDVKSSLWPRLHEVRIA